MEKSNFVFQALAIKEQEGFAALCLDVDVASEGATLIEAKENLREAVALYVESAIESNLPIIRPVPKEHNPLVTKGSDVVEEFTLNVNVHVTTYV